VHESGIGPTEKCSDVCSNGRCQGISGRTAITSKTTHVTLIRTEPDADSRITSTLILTAAACSPSNGRHRMYDDQSALSPAALTTLPHFSVSAAIRRPKSEGEPGNGVPPKSTIRLCILESLRGAIAESW
jgi:hypothetical protein